MMENKLVSFDFLRIAFFAQTYERCVVQQTYCFEQALDIFADCLTDDFAINSLLQTTIRINVLRAYLQKAFSH